MKGLEVVKQSEGLNVQELGYFEEMVERGVDLKESGRIRPGMEVFVNRDEGRLCFRPMPLKMPEHDLEKIEADLISLQQRYIPARRDIVKRFAEGVPSEEWKRRPIGIFLQYIADRLGEQFVRVQHYTRPRPKWDLAGEYVDSPNYVYNLVTINFLVNITNDFIAKMDAGRFTQASKLDEYAKGCIKLIEAHERGQKLSLIAEESVVLDEWRKQGLNPQDQRNWVTHVRELLKNADVIV